MRSVLNNAAAPLHLPTLEQTFTLRTNEGFVDAFAPALICACAAQAPGVKLNFVAKSEKGPQFLRDGERGSGDWGAEKYGTGNSAAGVVFAIVLLA